MSVVPVPGTDFRPAQSAPAKPPHAIPLNLKPVIGAAPSSDYTQQEKRNYYRRSRWFGGFCCCACAVGAIALIVWLLMQTEPAPAPPPPSLPMSTGASLTIEFPPSPGMRPPSLSLPPVYLYTNANGVCSGGTTPATEEQCVEYSTQRGFEFARKYATISHATVEGCWLHTETGFVYYNLETGISCGDPDYSWTSCICASPAPSATGAGATITFGNVTFLEYACVEIAPQYSTAAFLVSAARRLASGRHLAVLDVEALRGAMVKLLPGDVQPSHVDILDQGDNCKVCVAGGSDLLADDILDTMIDDTFPGMLAHELEIGGIDLVSAPIITFTELLVPPPPAALPGDVSSPQPLPQPTPPMQPLQPAPRLPPQPLPSQPPPSPGPGLPPPSLPPLDSPPPLPPSAPPPASQTPAVVIVIHGGTENPEDDSVTDVVVWANTPTTLQITGNHQVYEYDYIYWTRYSEDECSPAPVHSDLSGYLDSSLRTYVDVEPGIYFLCLRQGQRVAKHARIRLIAQHMPPAPPPSPPSPSTPPAAPTESPEPPPLPPDAPWEPAPASLLQNAQAKELAVLNASRETGANYLAEPPAEPSSPSAEPPPPVADPEPPVPDSGNGRALSEATGPERAEGPVPRTPPRVPDLDDHWAPWDSANDADIPDEDSEFALTQSTDIGNVDTDGSASAPNAGEVYSFQRNSIYDPDDLEEHGHVNVPADPLPTPSIITGEAPVLKAKMELPPPDKGSEYDRAEYDATFAEPVEGGPELAVEPSPAPDALIATAAMQDALYHEGHKAVLEELAWYSGSPGEAPPISSPGPEKEAAFDKTEHDKAVLEEMREMAPSLAAAINEASPIFSPRPEPGAAFLSHPTDLAAYESEVRSDNTLSQSELLEAELLVAAFDEASNAGRKMNSGEGRGANSKMESQKAGFLAAEERVAERAAERRLDESDESDANIPAEDLEFALVQQMERRLQAAQQMERMPDLDDHWAPGNSAKRDHAMHRRAAQGPLWSMRGLRSPDDRI